MSRNPSELARLDDEYEYWAAKLIGHNGTKAEKEAALLELRKLEKQLGIESKPYNHPEFPSSLSKR